MIYLAIHSDRLGCGFEPAAATLLSVCTPLIGVWREILRLMRGDPGGARGAEFLYFLDDLGVNQLVFLDVEMIGAGLEQVAALARMLTFCKFPSDLLGLELHASEKGKHVEHAGLIDVVAEAMLVGTLGGVTGSRVMIRSTVMLCCWSFLAIFSESSAP
jgi:hypothetical protein